MDEKLLSQESNDKELFDEKHSSEIKGKYDVDASPYQRNERIKSGKKHIILITFWIIILALCGISANEVFTYFFPDSYSFYKYAHLDDAFSDFISSSSNKERILMLSRICKIYDNERFVTFNDSLGEKATSRNFLNSDLDSLTFGEWIPTYIKECECSYISGYHTVMQSWKSL